MSKMVDMRNPSLSCYPPASRVAPLEGPDSLGIRHHVPHGAWQPRRPRGRRSLFGHAFQVRSLLYDLLDRLISRTLAFSIGPLSTFRLRHTDGGAIGKARQKMPGLPHASPC
jgi:hypothetical protein